MRNGEVSFWWQQLGLPPVRPRLPGDRDVDVAIIGGGYTGLWTAYYLAQADTSLRIAILEERFAGYGASGRNGGWLTNTITGGREQYLDRFGRPAVEAMQLAVNATVSEVIAVCAREGIDADIQLGGEYNVALNAAQQKRLATWAQDESRWSMADTQLFSSAAAKARLNIPGTTGALWHPHAARIQPAKLAQGLAQAVERAGVSIYENTRVEEFRPGVVVTDAGRLTAGTIIRATEGFTAALPGLHRDILPMNSSLIVTEPLPEHVWHQIGWQGAEVVADMAHSYFYAQRTADGRIALGGRGIPYRYGSRIDDEGSTAPSTVRQLHQLLQRLFPAAKDAALTHSWSGVLGVPRDWSASVGLDEQTRVGWAGGYVGTGVTSTNLAGRTLTDLILGRDTELTRMPWVNHRVRRWEIEPLRWVAVRSLYSAYRFADRQEARGRETTSPIATLADHISGRGH